MTPTLIVVVVVFLIILVIFLRFNVFWDAHDTSAIVGVELGGVVHEASSSFPAKGGLLNHMHQLECLVLGLFSPPILQCPLQVLERVAQE